MTSDRRQRQKEARATIRAKKRKKESRRELFRRVRFGLGVGFAVAVLLLVSNLLARNEGGLDETYLAFRDLPTACGAEAPPELTQMQFSEPEVVAIDQPVQATVSTSCGDIVIELDPSISPASVESFIFLARQGFYDGTVFHRIAENLVIQGGDPTATGSGNPGYQIRDEFPPADFVYERGVVALSKAAGRDTSGSQFFIAIGDEAEVLSPTFNVLGRVVDGFDTLDRIAAVPTTSQVNNPERSRPLEAVYIESITIEGP